MAESRQIGRLKIHLLGDSAAQLGKSFDDSLSRSMSFKDAMSETARTYRDIYVGGSLEDLRDQPGFDRAGFRPDSEGMRNTNAFGKPSGAESYFIVVTNKKHHLIQDGRTFAGSMDLSLVHELLHPTQIIRELTEAGRRADDSEARTQMREQKIAEELGKTPGKDFPDVLGSGVPYAVQLEPSETQPSPPGYPALPVDPMKYEGGAPLNSAQPISSPPANRSPVRRLVRVNGSTSPAISVVSPDGRGSVGNLFENQMSSPDGIFPHNPNLGVPPPEAESPLGSPLGIFSGKPMPVWTTPPPIFDTRDHSDAAGDQNRFAALGGLLWDGGKSQASALAAGAPAVPFALDRRDSVNNGVASPESGSGAAFVPPASVVQQPQKSAASLIMDYIQRLKPLEANRSQASAFDTGAWSVPSPNVITGGLGSAASPTPQPQNPQAPLSLMDAYLEYRKQLDARPPQASMFDTVAPAVPLVSADDSNLSRGLLGRLTALMGVDPQNPSQLAPSPQDDELRGFYRDDPTQPWFVQR